jgi:hypothetical protein
MIITSSNGCPLQRKAANPPQAQASHCPADCAELSANCPSQGPWWKTVLNQDASSSLTHRGDTAILGSSPFSPTKLDRLVRDSSLTSAELSRWLA